MPKRHCRQPQRLAAKVLCVHNTTHPCTTPFPQLYDSEMDGCDITAANVRVTQWLDYGTGPGQVQLSGQRILIVDEVRSDR